MSDEKNSNQTSNHNKNRRSGLDRRWIIAPHNGQDRRSGKDRRTGLNSGDGLMTDEMDSSDMSTFKDLLLANSLQVDAVAQLLIEKGIITKDEFFDMLKRVQAEYEKKGEPVS
jgi:beta-N-acetylglucosaminidase